ncbi:hypothetical protein ANCDUO_06781 [Ancylostoma duodenale]|uniref:Uncharacterized protein n=1 Tax=Ancylostoma duodenale TaxID=51022 RepID=A0A0C2GNP6_9BILA|nr:hypothetical protein ANCDUO_06781 [Ancylostoma duodenale]
MDQGRSHATSFAPFMHRLQRDNHSVSLYFNTYKPEIDFGMKNELIDLSEGNWDLVFADSLFAVCGYGIAHLNRRPHAMIHSSDVEGAQGTAKAFHRNYGILPPNFMSYKYAWQDPSFFLDRLKSATDWFGSIVVTNVLSDQLMRQQTGDLHNGCLQQFTALYMVCSFEPPRVNG